MDTLAHTAYGNVHLTVSLAHVDTLTGGVLVMLVGSDIIVPKAFVQLILQYFTYKRSVFNWNKKKIEKLYFDIYKLLFKNIVSCDTCFNWLQNVKITKYLIETVFVFFPFFFFVFCFVLVNFISSIQYMKKANNSQYPPEAEYIPFRKKLFSWYCMKNSVMRKEK